MRYSHDTYGAIASLSSPDQCETLARAAVVDETMRALSLGIPRSLYRTAIMQDGAYRPADECALRMKELTDRKVREAREVIKHAV